MTEAWRYGGNQVRLWRTEAGKSREELGAESNYDAETVKSMELGRRRPTMQLLRAADQMFGAAGKLLAVAEYMKPEPFPKRSEEFMAAEAECVAFNNYEPLLIPGLLQSQEYMEALMGDSSPPVDAETIAERVGRRLTRQEAMERRIKTVYSFIIGEAAMRTEVGGKEVMRRQLHHLLKLSGLRNVFIQILPTGRACGAALRGPLVLMETPDHQLWAWADGQKTTAMYSHRDKVSSLTQTHGMIRMNALGAAESAEFIKRLAEEL
ncbi:transcriptional regulator [Streptomyces subrutilus]|uniref:Transcriptional regulator n=1 Tax=Streptomyces subrutilus TaxID=36818 RepID=A0A5P2UL43_9ACTN|nr:helix-turn-helix transcriptional regulator [Streptomyces subrutilus]QEU79055.1 XRE family transcriptional regulator [Streptomyces subrutilus]GGZ76873.1 transcriptional regulator [Streptomyces subrutilus]